MQNTGVTLTFKLRKKKKKQQQQHLAGKLELPKILLNFLMQPKTYAIIKLYRTKGLIMVALSNYIN